MYRINVDEASDRITRAGVELSILANINNDGDPFLASHLTSGQRKSQTDVPYNVVSFYCGGWDCLDCVNRIQSE